MIGIYEIAEIANVSPSAVANWRKRFPDFPVPIVDLKSGPVFGENQVKLWLARRQASDSPEAELFYDQLASKRGDPPELREKVEEVVEKLLKEATSTSWHPLRESAKRQDSSLFGCHRSSVRQRVRYSDDPYQGQSLWQNRRSVGLRKILGSLKPLIKLKSSTFYQFRNSLLMS